MGDLIAIVSGIVLVSLALLEVRLLRNLYWALKAIYRERQVFRAGINEKVIRKAEGR